MHQQPVNYVQRANLSLFKSKEVSLPAKHPEKGSLVYVGTISNQVRGVKLFSLSTSILGLCFQPIMYGKAVESTLPVVLKFFLGGFLNFFVFLTPALIHIFTKRYVAALYLNKDTGKFTATTYNFLVNEVETSFTSDKVEVPDTPGLLTTFKVNNKAFFVDPSMFLNHDAYIKLMSYDKPIDWSFKPDELAETPVKKEAKGQQ